MRQSLAGWCLSLLILGGIGSAHAATAYGHFILARETMYAGRTSFPAELKAVMDDLDCQRAFIGGAIAPDIAERFGHYGKTADAVQKMLAAAREHLAEANRRRDAQAIKAARQELAFSYGWLCHYGVDVNVHPVVNSVPMVGDAFQYNSKAEQAVHGLVEVELDAYLAATYGAAPADWKEQVLIPWDFLSEQSDEFKVDLRKTQWWMNLQTTGGEYLMEGMDPALAAWWAGVVRVSMQDAMTFIKDPGQVGNWDMCVGRMSSEEFAGLRQYEMAMNGGKLPPGWGGNYQQIFQTRQTEWAKIEAEARRFNHQLPALPSQGQLSFDAYAKQIDAWLARCLQKLEADKATDPLRVANRDMCLALAKRIQEGGNHVYCHNCGKVTAQYWCPGDPDLGDHWMCGCSAVTKVSQLLRPDGRTFTDYAGSRIAVNDALQAKLRALAARLKSPDGRTSPAVRQEINQFIAAANGQAPAPITTAPTATVRPLAIAAKPSGAGTGKAGGTGTRPMTTGVGQPTTPTTPSTGKPPATPTIPGTGQTAGGTTGGTGGSTGQTGAAGGQAQGTVVPPGGGVVRNAQYGFTMKVPAGWKNDPIGAGEDVTQRFRLNGAKATLVEITRVATGGLTLEQLRQVAAQIMAGNSALAQKGQERVLQVPKGTGLDVVYTGTQGGHEIMTVVRFISVANATYVVAGTVPANATQAEQLAVSGMIESFTWPTP